MKLLMIGLCCSLAAWGAGKGKCTNPSLQWEIRSTYIDNSTLNAIQSDGSPYIDGQQSVSATIDDCGGSHDAKLVLLDGIRNAFVSFARQLNTTSLTPAQVQSGQTVGCMNICWLFMIRNLTHVPVGTDRWHEYDFTTHLAGGGPLNSHLVMMNPTAAAVPPSSDPAVNTPYTNSLVHVRHCPASFTGTSDLCTPGKPEQWFVWPEPGVSIGGVPQQVASLVIDGVRRNPGGSGGEYGIPFLFVLTAR